MISKPPAMYPAMPAGHVMEAVKVIVTALIVAILILGFVVLSLGLGGEGHGGVGPDRPPQPVTSAPESALSPALTAR